MFSMTANTLLPSVTIPSTITSIGKLFIRIINISFILSGKYAFSQCSSITQITFTNGLTTIGYGMLDMLNLTTPAVSPTLLQSLSIPSSVTYIGKIHISI